AIKVPEQQSNGTHIVRIDIPQLLQHMLRRVPVYYVFPEPPWSGSLMSSTWLGPERRAELAYRRARYRWFGKWTIVCSAVDLHSVLRPPPSVQAMDLPNPFPAGYWWQEFWRLYRYCIIPGLIGVPAGSAIHADRSGRIRGEELRRILIDLRRSTAELEGAS